MNNGLMQNSLRSAMLLLALVCATAAATARADDRGRIDYDVLKREQRGLGNVLTDAETDLASGETRMRDNSLRLSAEDVARSASKAAHLRAMAQLHPERCSRTTGAFLLPASSAQANLTNVFFSNIKPRIIKLEDDLRNYLGRLERLDPKLAAELRTLMTEYDRAAQAVVSASADNPGSIEYNPTKIDNEAAKHLGHNSIFNDVSTDADSATRKANQGPDGGNNSGGGNSPNGANGPGGGISSGGVNNSNGGAGGNTGGTGGGNSAAGAPVTSVTGIHGSIRDTGGQILNADDFVDNKTLVKRTKSDNGILTREEKTTGDLVQDGSGGATFKKKDSKVIDWQFDIEPSETGFTLVDRSGGPADGDKGFSVESWNVKDPTGQSQDFPGATQLKYTMSASGKYVITAKVMTNLKTSFTIYISPVNN